MEFLLNVAFGLLAGWFVDWLLEKKMGVDGTVAVIVAVIVGLIVFLSDLAARIV